MKSCPTQIISLGENKLVKTHHAGTSFDDHLINKYLNQRQEELEIKYRINNIVADTTPIDALTKKIDKLDERINNNCSSISSIKQELEAFKLSMGLKGRI